MYNLSLSQAPAEGVTRDQLREQIRAQVEQATRDARAAMREAEAARAQAQGAGPGLPGAPEIPGPPGGIPTISVKGMPWEADIPPRVKDVSIAFFITCAVIIVGFPIMRAIGKRIERAAPVPVTIPTEMQAQMQHLMQSVDAIAIEVERISEGQRFAAKMLAERNPEA
jgi:hypothetical protein